MSEHVHWVGAIDWAIRDFHGYLTSRGTTYNAYLILADKVTLIDTVKGPFMDEMMSRIAALIDPADIDCIVSNHSEMDHTGCLPQVIEAVKPERVFASVNGVKALQQHFHLNGDIEAVKDGDSLSLGNMDLAFVETRMLHWPDSMFTYLAEDGVLFSQDAFGMHLASSERFADEIEEGALRYEAAKYYANILTPFSPLVLKLFEKLEPLHLDIEIIAPDHGPIYREGLDWILGRWAQWAAQKPAAKAVVVYDTMWGSTERMAQAIGSGLSAGGVSVKQMPLRSCHRSDIATELLDAGALLVGSPTMNQEMFPTVADILTYLRGLKRQNLIGQSFGSYGWSGKVVDKLNEWLTSMKVELVGEPVSVQYVPDDEALERCYALGALVAENVKERLGD